MGRRSALFWAVIAVALLGLAIYVPAYVARSATAPDGPVDFLSSPLDGWRFMVDATRKVPDARVGTPAQARARAVSLFAATGVQPTRVDLLYVPAGELRVGSGQGSHMQPTNSTLVWRVTGRTRPNGPLVTVGLIDLSTGALVYDVRDD
jgi:hypothetical protein